MIRIFRAIVPPIGIGFITLSRSWLIQLFTVNQPSVLRTPRGAYLTERIPKGSVDMQVIFPRYSTSQGRPEWLRTLAGRSPSPIPPALLPREGRRLVKAVPERAGPRAAPIDIVLVEAGKPAPMLMLPPDEFRYEVADDPAHRIN